MAKCGCSGTSTCNCVVKAGANVTVIGAGTIGSPYVISASPSGIAVADTSTVDLTLLAGILTAKVLLDPALGNLIAVAAGGLRVDCTDVRTCFTGGQSINITSGVIDVCISTDVDNALTLGTDGCLYIASSATTAVTVAPLDTDTIDMVVTGGPAYIVSANAIIDPVAGNLLTSSAAGLLVANPVITLKTQARLLNATDSWTPGTDVLGILTSVGFVVLAGTADLEDFNGTLSPGLPQSTAAQWSALDGNVLTGPNFITANTPGQVLVTWTEQ